VYRRYLVCGHNRATVGLIRWNLCDLRNTPERFQAKACPALDAGWTPVRVKKTRQIKNLEPRFDSIETEKALAG
jgi:hypothetical protein